MPTVRDKTTMRADLMKLCDAVIEGLEHGNGDDYFIGIDGKRPFGFSGDTAHSVLADVLEIETVGGEYSDDLIDYANDLIEKIIPTIQDVWKKHRPKA